VKPTRILSIGECVEKKELDSVVGITK